MANAGPQSISGFNINAFRAMIAKRGVMGTSAFMAYFPIPPGMQNRSATSTFSDVAREMNMFCDAASIPGVMWQTAGVRRFGYGPEEQTPVAPNFEPVILSFICDANARDWQFFREWMMLCGNFNNQISMTSESGSIGGSPSMSYELGYQEDYATNVAVSLFSDDGTERMRIILREAWPTLITPMKVGWGDKNGLARFSVVFNMQDWYHDFDNPSVTLSGTQVPGSQQQIIKSSPQIPNITI